MPERTSNTLFTRVRARMPFFNGWILAVISFALVTHVAPVYILTAILLISVLVQPGVLKDLQFVFRTPISWAFIAYFGVFFVSLLWTEDIEWGKRMVLRQMPFLLFPLYFLVAMRGNPRRCISFYIAGVAISAAFAYYNWMQLYVFPSWPVGPFTVNKSPGDTAPFVDRIMYSPILALGAYFVAYRLVIEKGSAISKAAYGFLFTVIAINLLFSDGRAGMVGFFALFVILIMQRFPRHPVKASLLGVASVSLIFMLGYSLSGKLRERIDLAVYEFQDRTVNINTSVGLRMNFVLNSARIILDNPILGVGAGDFPKAYREVNTRFSPDAVATPNPHNQLMLVLTTTGVLGAATLLSLVLSAAIACRNLDTESRHHLTAIWVGFAVMSQFESYLWRSNTAFIFCVLTAVSLATLQRRETPIEREQ